MSGERPRHWIGFDLGGTKMLATVFNAAFEPIGRRRKKTRGHEGEKAGIERISKTIWDVLDDVDLDAGDVGGIGIGCPGPIDLEAGVIREAPNLGWNDVPIRDALQKEFGVPVVVANDVDAGVFGEYRFGAGRGGRCVLGVFPGTGIGGGCVYEGRIFRGRVHSCMEIGHVYVGETGPIGGGDRRGIVELGASRLAISAAAAQAAYRGQAPQLMEAEGTDLRNIRSGALADAVKSGDTAIERIVREAGEQIGIALASAVHLLAPDVVVLGGGLVEAMPELFVESISASARERLLPTFAADLTVKVAELGDDAAVMGAAAWARESIPEPAPSTVGS